MPHLLSKKCITAGIDEAGRGPLAGPVVAGACIITTPLFPVEKPWPCWSPKLKTIPLIADSKKLSEDQREASFTWITTHCPFGVSMVSAEEIDHMGILEATQKAMQEAVAQLAEILEPTYLLIDGRDQIWLDYPHSSIIDGDQKEPCISAASIVAKVTRDRIMIEYSKKFPNYNFEKHKGYGTAEHRAAIEKHGLCPIHRRTFLKSVQTIPVSQVVL